MEDAHCCHLELKSGSDSSAAETSSLFGVFDGHGGKNDMATTVLNPFTSPSPSFFC